MLARFIRVWNSRARRRSARRHKTHLARWRVTARHPPSWDERNALIASLIPAHSRVLDIGAGFQSLRSLLDECEYQPCDVVKSTPDTWHMDFNRDLYPSFPRRPFDFVVLSGVLEYAHNLGALLLRASRYGNITIASYAPWHPDQTIVSRETQGWFNHLTEEEFARQLTELKLAYRIVARCLDGQIICEILPIARSEAKRLPGLAR